VPRHTLTRDRLTWIVYGQLAIFGYWLYGFGPAVPLLREEQHTSRAVASLHGTALAVGSVLGGLALPWLVRRYGRARLMWVGQFGLAGAILGLWMARPLPATLACVVAGGIAGSLVANGAVIALTAHHGAAGPASVSEANAIAAGVGTVAPLIVGGAVAAGLGWRPGLAVAALAAPGLALAAWLLRVRIPAGPVAAGTQPVRRRLPGRYWRCWASLVATGGVEVCITLWVADVLRAHAGASPAAATAAVSAMVGGMCAGRVIGARFALRVAPARLLLGSLAVSAAGFAVLWSATVPWLAIGGLIVAGLGNAMHYPLAIGLAVDNSGGQPEVAVARSSWALGAAFGVAPFALGALADRIGPHPAFLLVPAFLAAAAVAVLPLARQRQPVGDRQHDGLDPVVGGDPVVEGDDRAVIG